MRLLWGRIQDSGDLRKVKAMEDNIALLWSLLAESAEWANRQTPRNDALATVANDAREQVIQNTTAQHLARELVQVLAAEDRRGLTDTLEDIRIKIGEDPPTREQLVEAIDTMHRYAHGEGDAESYFPACRTVRRFLNDPPKESV
jgi:hypothetical protein